MNRPSITLVVQHPQNKISKEHNGQKKQHKYGILPTTSSIQVRLMLGLLIILSVIVSCYILTLAFFIRLLQAPLRRVQCRGIPFMAMFRFLYVLQLAVDTDKNAATIIASGTTELHCIGFWIIQGLNTPNALLTGAMCNPTSHCVNEK